MDMEGDMRLDAEAEWGEQIRPLPPPPRPMIRRQ